MNKYVYKNANTQQTFDIRKHAREAYAHMCSYEDNFFNTYQRLASSMSDMDAQY